MALETESDETTGSTEPVSLFLIGPMGAGKSTVGRFLAQLLKREFVDSDRVIEERTGARIPLIFDVEGEGGFRAREHAVIDELTQHPCLVLATGGGAILDPDNRRCLRERGLVIYLKTSIAQQLQRTARDRNRPLLNTENPRKRLEELMAIRGPLYESLAHIIEVTDGKSPRRMALRLARQVRERARAQSVE